MRAIREQVDEFIEGLFDGSIIIKMRTTVSNATETGAPVGSLSKAIEKRLEPLRSQVIMLTEDNIRLYRAAKDEQEKDRLANEMFDRIVSLRVNGIIHNNPDTLKEVTFWKNRCLTVELELANEEKQIIALNDTITKLRVGIGAIK